MGTDKKQAVVFELDEALKGKKSICTADGNKAKIVFYSKNVKDFYQLVVNINNSDGSEEVLRYTSDGVCENGKDGYKLQFVEEERCGYANVYETSRGEHWLSKVFKDFAEAKKVGRQNQRIGKYIATIKVQW